MLISRKSNKSKMILNYIALAIATLIIFSASHASESRQLDTHQDNISIATANKSLRRLDFKITGTSCAVCLLTIERRIKTIDGVLKVAVMLRSPHGGVVLYDGNKATSQKILETGKGNEDKTKFEDVRDTKINKMPLILVPVFKDIKYSGNQSMISPLSREGIPVR